jgi:hypothetical protein
LFYGTENILKLLSCNDVLIVPVAALNNDENGVFQQEITDVVHIRNEAIYKIREREPATRAPSFVVLPRAPSRSMRTAL